MADYILVHGGNVSTDTWNELVKRNEYPAGKLLGGKIWNKVIPLINNKSHKVFAPTLLDEHNHGLSDHIQQICVLIREHELKDVILVGTSYGGLVITGIADRLPTNIRVLVYLDAAFPQPGQSLSDILSEAHFSPEVVLGGLPKAYIEKIHYDPKNIKPLSKIYIQCTKSSFFPLTKRIVNKIVHDKSWKIFELPTSHLPQATMPNRLAKLLLSIT